jgi:outer membrane protein TolC
MLLVDRLQLNLSVFFLFGFVQCGLIHAIDLKYAPISLNQYLEVVKLNNAEISNASLDVQTAVANKEAQSLYRLSPSVSFFRGNLQNQVPYGSYSTPSSNTYALSFNLEGWGKRSARKELAQAQIEASQTQLLSTNSDIQINAINTYIDTLRLSLMVKMYQATLDKLEAYRSNPTLAGAQKFLMEQKASADKDMIFTSLNLLNFSGDVLQNPPYPIGNLNFPPQSIKIEELIEQANNNRVEVLNLMASIKVADKNVNLTAKNRNIDILPFVSHTRTPQYQYNSGASYSLPAIGNLLPAQTINSSGTTYTAQNQTTVGLTIPIPISSYLQSADIVSAANLKLQYEKRLRDLKVQIRVQVLQASLQYEVAKDSLLEAQKAFETAVGKLTKDSVTALMHVSEKEGMLLDSKANHIKALINLWRLSGNYTVPNL